MNENFEVTLPKLGESIMNATIVKWFKKEGESVGKDEPLLEVSTDKVNSEIPSPVAGKLKKIHAQPEQELNVGELLAIITTEAGTAGAPKAKAEKPTESAPSEDKKDYYSPALLRIARENNISFEELAKIPGTGGGGRVTKKDLEAYISTKKEKPCPMAAPVPTGKDIEHIKMTGMRKAIAENMVRSFYQAPHASLICEVDVTDAMKAIKREKEAFLKKHGVKLTITTLVARAIARALREYPLLNASLQEDTIVVKRFVNLGIAVSVEQGVMVPVIKGCQNMHLHEIAKTIADFAQKARTNSLSPDDVQEGTITMTNFGISGIQIGIPIIRYPEVAIVGIGGITKRVVVLDDDNFGVRKIMNICLTFDHRIIDGMYGCEFLAALRNHLEKDLEINS
ncbi:MAG: Dihydrolipoyllysine-residue acetyltransferase component of pyruvate dehydrogenase complex [Chlamydiae bacterium]|nr:Dihydrolipoyllysine-residue acetyltransferase component of pyruvate dehydrogenase complex [Chlamydiota bacterium]